MKKWIPLFAAILMEVTATLSLRAAVDHPAWYTLVTVGYLGAFAALSVALRNGLGVGVAYGIWAASGVVLTAVLAAVIFNDALTATMGVGIALVIAGVLCVELGSQHAQRREEEGTA